MTKLLKLQLVRTSVQFRSRYFVGTQCYYGSRQAHSVSASATTTVMSPQPSLLLNRRHIDQSSWHGSLINRQNQHETFMTANATTTRRRRYYSSSLMASFSFPSKDNIDSSQQQQQRHNHHEFFQQQLLEMVEERRQLFGGDDDDNHIKFGDGEDSDDLTGLANRSMTIRRPPRQQQQQQTHDQETQVTVGVDEDIIKHNYKEHGDKDDDDDFETMKMERESMFQFSQEERQAWLSTSTNHQQDEKQTQVEQQQSLHQILEEVERLRRIEQDDDDDDENQLNIKSNRNSSRNNNTFDRNLTRIKAFDTQSHPSSMSSTVKDHHESFSHVSVDGSSIHMVDVGSKVPTKRTATAETKLWLPPAVMNAFHKLSNDGNDAVKDTTTIDANELVGTKGPIFATAKIAGIMAAKRTSELIPLCHPLPLDQVQIDIQLSSGTKKTKYGSKDNDGDHADCEDNNGGGVVTIHCTCRVTHKTGVEMEALTGATVAALTIYDMTKAVSHEIVIRETRLLSKHGGKRTVG